MPHINWKKSSHSGPNSDDCVEVADFPGGGRAVRDSKNPTGPILTFTVAEWTAFLRKVKNGRLL